MIANCSRVSTRSPSHQAVPDFDCPCVQTSDNRIMRGAPDFEALTDTIAFDSAASGAGDGPRPIRLAPGWQAFRQHFYLHASADVCFPADSDGMRLHVKAKGRVLIILDGRQILLEVCCS